MTFASFHCVGNLQVDRDKLNNRHNGSFKMEAPSLISRGIIKSGPAAFVVLINCRTSSMSVSVMCSCVSLSQSGLIGSGTVELESSRFDCSLKKSLINSHFAKLSHIKSSSVCKEGIERFLLEPSSLLTRFHQFLLPDDSAIFFRIL
jgi:hypothetical protein